MEEVRERHARLLASSPMVLDEEPRGKVRDHKRWKELVDEDGECEGIRGEGAAAGPSLGPTFFPAESTVRNDYSQHFVDTGQLPGNAVGNPGKARRFEEYPKLKRLVEVKASLAASLSHPPTFLQADLLPSTAPPTSMTAGMFHLATLLPIKFDVVIIDPPLESYEWESVPSGGEQSSRAWSWDQVAALPIPQIMAKESFIFLWVGSGASDGLERGREVLMRWGYRRCEDIVWVQTNSDNGGTLVQATSSSNFAKSAQHCLMAIRGTVRRSTDTRFVHCNIDTDVILWPGETCAGTNCTIDTRSKPPEMMDLVENFCLGTRRLELFGRNRNLRRGWLTIGLDVGPQGPDWDEAQKGENACAAAAATGRTVLAYEKAMYDSFFGVDRAGCVLAERTNLIPFHEEVDALRPRSPSSGSDRRTLSPSTRVVMQAHHNPIRLSPDQGAGKAASLKQFAGGAGISGLGAGGPLVVSVPSGSEMLSGAQASVFQSQTAAAASPPHTRFNAATGLSRQRRPPPSN